MRAVQPACLPSVWAHKASEVAAVGPVLPRVRLPETGLPDTWLYHGRTTGTRSGSIVAPETVPKKGELSQLQAVHEALEAEWQPQTSPKPSSSTRLPPAGGAAAVKCAAGCLDKHTLYNDARRRKHATTKMEIVVVAFRDHKTAQQISRISLYIGRNFRQMYRCFQQIVQLRKSSPIEPAVEAQPQPEPPLKTVADIEAALTNSWPFRPQSPAPEPEPDLVFTDPPTIPEPDPDVEYVLEYGPYSGVEPLRSLGNIGVNPRSSAADKDEDLPARPIPPGVADSSEPAISNRRPEKVS